MTEKNSAIKKDTTTKVLLIRSLRNEFLPGLLETLRGRYQWQELILLTHRTTLDPQYLNHLIDDVIIYESRGDFGILSSPKGIIRHLRAIRFDLVLFPYFYSPTTGYYNVVCFASVLGARKIAAVNLEGSLTIINKGLLLGILGRSVGATLLTLLLGSILTFYAFIVITANRFFPKKDISDEKHQL
jgi:hypothetical protein